MSLRYVGAYLMAVLGGSEHPSVADVKKILESVGAEYDADIAEKLVSELEGKNIHDVIASGKDKLKGFGGGGGGVAVAAGSATAASAAVAKVEEKVEEEEE